ncbi:DNA glycosylase AlkZ-like family protein [Rothia uropygioeca]|uniref:DNA glycosylase AlkZ-like family protein n=1 Tax=Kocuria sp. 257 TaxID=2021970 RepID=UPI0013EA7E24|nr:crosslink repair DNA glycosylase YcaQ family protein [Kocuria sp. 257]
MPCLCDRDPTGGGGLGRAAVNDVGDYFRIPGDVDVAAVADDAGYERIRVEGSKGVWFVDPEALAEVTEGQSSGPSLGVTVLSPFDSLIRTRARLRDVFGKHCLLEAYKPSTAREFRYFSMPILAGRRLVGRVAARAKAGAVEIENFECDAEVSAFAIRSAAKTQLKTWTMPVRG